MCGIITAIQLNNHKSFDPIDRVLSGFENQRERGVDGFGYVAITDGVLIYDRFKTEEKMKEGLKNLREKKPKMLFFHHRKPTSSSAPVTAQACHPIMIEDDSLKHSYFLLHNGYIVNNGTCKKRHEKGGYKYSTEIESYYSDPEKPHLTHVDSEALGYEMAKFVEGESIFIQADGAMSVFLLQTDKETKQPKNLYFFRNSKRPMKFFRNQAGIFMASKGKGEDLPEEVFYILDLKTFELSSEELDYSLTYGYCLKNQEKEEEKDNDDTYEIDTDNLFNEEEEPPKNLSVARNVPVDELYNKDLYEYSRGSSEYWTGKRLEELYQIKVEIKTDLKEARDVGDTGTKEICKLELVEIETKIEKLENTLSSQ